MSETVKVAEVEWTWRDSWSGPESDGYSYHPDLAAARKHIDEYWATMPNEVPEAYRSPSAPVLVDVNSVFGILVLGKGIINTQNKAS